MRRHALMFCSSLICLAAGCHQRPPKTDDPTVSQCLTDRPVYIGGVLSFGADETPDDAELHRVRLDEYTVRVMTPAGWRGSAVGNAAWMSYGDTGARFVIYPPDGSHLERVRDWRSLHAEGIGESVGPVISVPTGRQPVFYSYSRDSGERRGLVYGLTLASGDGDLSLVATAVWPRRLDCLVPPIVLAAVNGVELERP